MKLKVRNESFARAISWQGMMPLMRGKVQVGEVAECEYCTKAIPAPAGPSLRIVPFLRTQWTLWEQRFDYRLE